MFRAPGITLAPLAMHHASAIWAGSVGPPTSVATSRIVAMSTLKAGSATYCCAIPLRGPSGRRVREHLQRKQRSHSSGIVSLGHSRLGYRLGLGRCDGPNYLGIELTARVDQPVLEREGVEQRELDLVGRQPRAALLQPRAGRAHRVDAVVAHAHLLDEAAVDAVGQAVPVLRVAPRVREVDLVEVDRPS
eukprot:scaffold28670_cov66-Phaeocystis_antarctica.AAC.5